MAMRSAKWQQKLLLFPWKTVRRRVSRLAECMKRSASAVWIFIMDFHQKEVNQGTVGVLFAVDWQVRAVARGFLHFWEKV